MACRMHLTEYAILYELNKVCIGPYSLHWSTGLHWCTVCGVTSQTFCQRGNWQRILYAVAPLAQPYISEICVESPFIIGSTASLACTARSTVPLTFQWFVNDSSVVDVFPNTTFEPDQLPDHFEQHVMRLANVDMHFAGTYKCVATNTQGTRAASINVTVAGK